jgi:cytochrome c biogenesis protein CcmG, thiol:disulfide interchange protein DsbE
MKLSVFAPLAVMIAIGIGLGVGLTNDPRALPSALVDKPLPAFNLPPVRAEERGFKHDDVKGEVALINVFASWCISCRVEHPTLMRLADEKRVPLYGVDWRDKREDGAAWLAAFGDPFKLVGEDQNSKLAIELGVTGAPETYVIDHTGRIRYKQIGPITEDVWRDVIEPLILSLEQEAAS